ncbi:alpha/beta hydrolase fold [Arthrobacter alpinus]|uniref:Alpha/beta hydrolase fold n=1 Tax=Arthrobacter alpinus TaxID=656366 RepID=A0A1H5MH78_9MICC|nr:alpha/beta hydrolase [Arthrobacter alpinus]SEE87798.1 alpha/beta hydrolase fold [Arthrobacter alpinus]
MSQRPWREIFCPEELAGRPIFIVLPGGGYHRQADHEGAPVAHWLNSLGLNAMVLHYAVAPDYPGKALHPAPLNDAQETLRWLRSGESGLEIDAERIGVLGFSAGGHLAAALSTGAGSTPTADRPELAVLAYPVISLVSHCHQGSVNALLGPEATWEQRRALSAELTVDTDTPPTFLWHTADDDAVPVENSLDYAAALARHHVPFELHVFPHGHHGLGLALDEGEAGRHPAAEWTSRCAAWLSGQGWRTTA